MAQVEEERPLDRLHPQHTRQRRLCCGQAAFLVLRDQRPTNRGSLAAGEDTSANKQFTANPGEQAVVFPPPLTHHAAHLGFLPPEFFRLGLGALQELDLSANFLTGIVPDSVSQLVALQSLLLDHHALVGTVPVSIGQLQALHYIALGGSQFEPADAATGALAPAQVLQLTRHQRCRISI